MASLFRKLLALVILAVVLLMLYALVGGPLLAYYDTLDQERFQLQKRLHSYRIIASSKDQVIEQTRLNIDDRAKHTLYLESEKPALATAELQTLVKDRALLAGAELLSSQPVITELDELGLIAVAIHCRGDIFALQKMMHSIEYSQPVLVIEQIEVARGTQNVYRGNLNSSDKQALDIKFTVAGFIKS